MRWLRLLLVVGLGAAVAGCAAPQYMSPQVTEADIAAVRAVRRAEAPKVERSAAEMEQVVARVVARLRPAISGLCLSVSGTACAFEARLVREDDAINAYAGPGGGVYITTGMLRHLASDDEVAFVLSHEIAHHMANHIEEKQQNAAVGAAIGAIILGGLAAYAQQGSSQPDRQLVANAAHAGASLGATGGVLSYSKEQEREADYLGMYAMDKAGYDVTAAAAVMDTFATLHPSSAGTTSFFGTHPSAPEREARATKVVREIAAKRRRGGEIMPNRAPVE